MSIAIECRGRAVISKGTAAFAERTVPSIFCNRCIDGSFSSFSQDADRVRREHDSEWSQNAIKKTLSVPSRSFPALVPPYLIGAKPKR